MTIARAVTLPKSQTMEVEPLSFRLRSIASVIYRKWAALRLESIMPWVRGWALDCMVGCRDGIALGAVAWMTAFQVEQAARE
eukprot:12209220-Alexandrium_andersonii.AAC.1